MQPRMFLRRIRPFALAVLLLLGLLAAAWFLLSWSPEAVAATPAQRTPALTITTATPRHANWPTTLAASGSIAPWQEASVGAQVGGYQLAARQR
jgi:multidrug efflux pump subunit AcrA (membrane-fusion protein)